MEQVRRAPDYVVLHSNVGGMFNQGDVIPSGTYSEEQLARLVGLGAIEAVDPAGEAFADRVEPSVPVNAPVAGNEVLPPSPAREVPQSAEEFKAQQDAASFGDAGGDPLAAADLTDEQRANLRAAGYDSAAAISAASDDELDRVPGVGPAAVRALRDATR